MIVVITMMSMVVQGSKDYSDHSLLKVQLNQETNQHHQDLFNLLLEKFDVWGKDHQDQDQDQNRDWFHVFGNKVDLIDLLESYQVEYRVMSDEVQQSILNQQLNLVSKDKASWFEDYHNLTEISEWYRQLAVTYPRISTYVDSIGKSWESRDIFAFHITASTNSTRPKIWTQCNIHAREWITGATCQYIVNELLTKYGTDTEITNLINSVEFVFIPIVNPDGYDYTWTRDRLWRKNRRNNGNSYGVDLNRNFNAQWGGVGSSPTPSSDTYRGPSAESEPETKALVQYYSKFNNIVGAIDMHSYSQYVLRPFTHVNTSPKDEANMKTVTDEMVRIIKSVHGKTYTAGRWYNTLYASSGVAQDYYYSKGAYGITIELRPDSSVPGFVLPPDEIIPSGEEITPSFVYFAKYCVENPLF